MCDGSIRPCWKFLMLLGVLRILRYRGSREFEHVLGIGAEPEEIQRPKSPMREGTVVGAKAMSRGSSLFLSLFC